MHKLWQKKLALHLSKDIVDIVQFGSSTLEGSEPNDLDIAVIFQKIPLKVQLEQAQQIKKQLQQHVELPVHCKSFDIINLFEESNFARENILIHGMSLLSKSPFALRFGLSPKIFVTYALASLKKKEKVRFHYMLQGKKGLYGMLRKYEGNLMKPGMIEIQPRYERIFLEAMEKYKIPIGVKRILISR